MRKQILFIHGGGKDGYEVDTKMVVALQEALGEGYQVINPQMQTDESAPDFGWLKQIGEEIDKLPNGAFLAAHSLGASFLLKYLSENKISKTIAGIFLIATPFWSGREDWVQGLKLQQDFAQNLLQNSPIFFYHCRDDKEIPFDHLEHYKQKIPWAILREFETGGHQLFNKLDLVAEDIISL